MVLLIIEVRKLDQLCKGNKNIPLWHVEIDIKMELSRRQLAKKIKIWVAAAVAKSLQSCPTLCDPRDSSPPGSPRPWDSPGKNTGVGCHFLLQCMKVKSERKVAQLCPTPSDPMDCSPPGSSIHGIFQARVLEWVAIPFSEIWAREIQKL